MTTSDFKFERWSRYSFAESRLNWSAWTVLVALYDVTDGPGARPIAVAEFPEGFTAVLPEHGVVEAVPPKLGALMELVVGGEIHVSVSVATRLMFRERRLSF